MITRNQPSSPQLAARLVRLSRLVAGAAVCTVAVLLPGGSANAAEGVHSLAGSTYTWSVGHPGVTAWGSYSYRNGRVYIWGKVKDTKADGRSANLSLQFRHDGPSVPRREDVTVGGKGKTRGFSFNSNRRNVAVQACTKNSHWLSCSKWKWL